MSTSRPSGDLRDRLSTFRTRLRLFFLVIVVVPMVAVTLVVFRLIAESEQGQADARIAARQDAAMSLAYDARQQADRLAARFGRDPGLAQALRRDDPNAISTAARRLLHATAAARVAILTHGAVAADAGSADAIFPASRDLLVAGRRIARLQVSTVVAGDYARTVRRVTHLDVIVRRGAAVIAATLPGRPPATWPSNPGTVRLDNTKYQAATFGIPGFAGEETAVALLEPQARTTNEIRRARLVAGIVLAGFFLLALIAATVVSRALQGQIERFLVAARRLAAGDFSEPVPTRGRDEFAQLGDEFNTMSQQLEARMADLAQERLRLEISLRRIGETFASNLDREALLEILVRTAIDAVDAAGGRVSTRDAPASERAIAVSFGSLDDAAQAAVEDAERQTFAIGQPAFVEREGGHALAHPLRAGPAAGPAADDVTGAICVWRDRPFTHRERELFHYLAGQAAVSLENVALHETIERQAITDELTGLSNRRRFQETMAAEVERSKRFGQELGLVILDIDDFKSVNDTYGHQQGDLVLREVAGVLRRSSREIDEPARYGGEELAVVLPGTDLAGAYNFAERVREGIEALRLPILGDDAAPPMRVTASFGAASLPDSGDDVRAIVAAADGALYEAKRAGKNRTVAAA